MGGKYLLLLHYTLQGLTISVSDNMYRAYVAVAPEPLGFALHSYLLTDESVTDKQTN